MFLLFKTSEISRGRTHGSRTMESRVHRCYKRALQISQITGVFGVPVMCGCGKHPGCQAPMLAATANESMR
jgi:hypothetical protein